MTCLDVPVELSAWPSDGACAAALPSDYVQSCGRLPASQEDDRVSLTLGVGGGYTVWWTGVNRIGRTGEGAERSQHYVRPPLGLGPDIAIPVGGATTPVTVTVSLGAYGSAREEDGLSLVEAALSFTGPSTVSILCKLYSGSRSRMGISR